MRLRLFLLSVAWCRDVVTLTEQPQGSMLIDFIKLMAQHPDLRNFTTYLGWFGAPSVKPITVMTTMPKDEAPPSEPPAPTI